MTILHRKIMNDFDSKARTWDQNPQNVERASILANIISENLDKGALYSAMEYGCGTASLSFNLVRHFKSLLLADTSEGMLEIAKEKFQNTDLKDVKYINPDAIFNTGQQQIFDLIFTSMTLHHVDDIEDLLKKFYKLSHKGTLLCIADIYPEDGSFHGSGFTGHLGFDPEVLKGTLQACGYETLSYKKCCDVVKQIEGGGTGVFPVFIMICKAK